MWIIFNCLQGSQTSINVKSKHQGHTDGQKLKKENENQRKQNRSEMQKLSLCFLFFIPIITLLTTQGQTVLYRNPKGDGVKGEKKESSLLCFYRSVFLAFNAIFIFAQKWLRPLQNISLTRTAHDCDACRMVEIYV